MARSAGFYEMYRQMIDNLILPPTNLAHALTAVNQLFDAVVGSASWTVTRDRLFVKKDNDLKSRTEETLPADVLDFHMEICRMACSCSHDVLEEIEIATKKYRADALNHSLEEADQTFRYKSNDEKLAIIARMIGGGPSHSDQAVVFQQDH